MMRSDFYSYVYLDPRKPGRYTYGNFVTFLYEPFYVGKGTNNRKFSHLSERGNSKKSNKIRKILSEGFDLKEYIMVLRRNLPEYVALYCQECFWIDIIGREDQEAGPLLNRTDGGDGCVNPSPEVRQQSGNRLKEYLKEHGNPAEKRKGIPFDEFWGERSDFLRKQYGSPKEKHPLWQKGHSEKSKQLISKNHADMSGRKNPRAKKWYLVSPSGTVYETIGELGELVNKFGLSSTMLKNQINQIATINPTHTYITEKVRNTVGWKLSTNNPAMPPHDVLN